MIKIQESSVKLGQNSDTSFSAGSLRAARRAAGAVQHAVDWYVLFRFLHGFRLGIYILRRLTFVNTAPFFLVRLKWLQCPDWKTTECILCRPPPWPSCRNQWFT